MTEIKSALEIAMERTKSVKTDKTAIEADKIKKEGMAIVSRFLGEQGFNITESIKKYDKKQVNWIKKGMVGSLLANLVLPQELMDLKKIKRVGEAFFAIKKDDEFLKKVFVQLDSFFNEYLGEKDRIKEYLEKQYEPKLRQKEEELFKRMGQKVHLSTDQDPEFAGLLRKNMAVLEDKYQSVLSNVKKEIKAAF